MALRSGDVPYRNIVEAQDDMVLRFDDARTLLFVNRAFCQAFGGDARDWIGQRFDLAGEARGDEPARDRAVQFDSRHDLKDGAHWFSWRCVPLTDAGGFLGWQAVGRDVTTLRQELERLQRYCEEAKDASKAKSRFLATMTHEIRTPLNGILGMASLLLDTKLTPEQQSYTAAIGESGEALLAHINNILDYSKIEAGKVVLEQVDFNLAQLIQGITELLASRAYDKEIEIACHIDSETPVLVSGDEQRLRQIILNLANNAIKFTEQGGVRIAVSTYSGNTATEDVVLRFDIHDTGIGIAEAKQDFIFEEFAQADSSHSRKYEGTGLGLAICKKIIRAMGGEIWLQSKQGEGSTFSFTVELKQKVKQPLRPSARGLFGLKVLIVCASPTTSRAVQAQLDAPGVTIRCAASGSEALRCLKQDGGSFFTTLICDFALPDMSPIEFLNRVGQHYPSFPKSLILLSPRNRPQLDELLEAGYDAYLIKPVRQESLIHRIQRVHGLAETEELISADERAAEAERHDCSQPQIDRNLRVLLAEDNQINAILTASLLTRAGHQVDRVANGREVLEVLQHTPYDLILMDMRMPELDGLETTRKIRANEGPSQHMAIIALTANATEQDRRACLAAGMDDFLTKPLVSSALYEVLNRWTNSIEAAKVS